MAVLERPLARVYPEIDMVTTPTGRPVAMVHCNTCTSDLDAWVRVLGEMAGAAGAKLEKPRLYDLFYQKALEGEADCGGLVSYNYYSGEPVTGVESGRPLFMRRPDARFTLANFARVQLYAAMATLKLGMDILLVEEGVRLDTLLGHGGLFKTPVAGQKLLAGGACLWPRWKQRERAALGGWRFWRLTACAGPKAKHWKNIWLTRCSGGRRAACSSRTLPIRRVSRAF